MKLHVLELYSGIGGAHFAFQESGFDFTVVGAVDINNLANEVYKTNFPKTPLLQRNIESLTVKEWESLSPNVVWMSPPCQPFTRNGLKKDCSDYRTSSFLHILNILKQLSEKPLYILLENVKGFEESGAHEFLIETLCDCGYVFQEFLISPDQIGIPNSRLRYYLLAKLKPLCFEFQKSEIWCNIPPVASSHFMKKEPDPIKEYLEQEPLDYFSDYYLEDKILARYFLILDIVEPQHQRSCCFTKGYSHYIEGTGSVLKSNAKIELNDACSTANKGNDEQRLQTLKCLQLRYFTPREVANLMKFPSHFTFPSHFAKRQKYRLLGNSINVHVASTLIKILMNNSG